MATVNYTFKSGDTLPDLAVKYRTTTQAIVDMNPFIKSGGIKPGDTLRIPTIDTINYLIKPGDGLTDLAAKYKTTTQAIVDLNPSIRNSGFRPGDYIKIPTTATASAPKATGTSAVAVTPVSAGSVTPRVATAYSPATGATQVMGDQMKSNIADYTSSIWDVQTPEETTEKKFIPSFYDETLPKMRTEGFNIRIVYGGAVQSLIELNKFAKTGDSKAFDQFKNNTVRNLRNVFIRSVGQELDASGAPVYEVFEFVAKDIE